MSSRARRLEKKIGNFLNKQVEQKIEENPVLAQEVAPSVEIAQEASQITDEDARTNEVNNDVISHYNDVDEKVDFIRAMDMLDSKDKTMIDGDIEDLSNMDELAIQDQFGLNEDQNIDVIDEPGEPDINETSVSLDEVNAIKEKPPVEETPIEQVRKRVEESTEQLKESEDLLNLKSTEASQDKPSIEQPQLDVPEITTTKEAPTKSTVSAAVNSSLPSNLDVGSGHVNSKGVNISDTPETVTASSINPIIRSESSVGEAPNEAMKSSTKGSTHEDVGSFLKPVFDIGHLGGNIKTSKSKLPSGGGHTLKSGSDVDPEDIGLDIAGMIQMILSASQKWPVNDQGWKGKDCGGHLVLTREDVVLVDNKKAQDIQPDLLKEVVKHLDS